MVKELKVPTVTSTSIIARCISDKPMDLFLEASDRAGNIVNKKSAYRYFHKNEYLHSIEIDGLLPNTHYEVKAIEKEPLYTSLKTQMTTLRNIESEHLLRFGILADPHIQFPCVTYGKNRLFEHALELVESAIKKMIRLGVEFIVMPGDITDRGTDEEIDIVKKMIDMTELPCYPICGNHEFQPAKFKEAFNIGKGYYSFSKKGIHFIMLDIPESYSLKDEQIKWIIHDLEKNRDYPTFLFSHLCLSPHPYLEKIDDHFINNHKEISVVLDKYPQIKMAFAGHKNIPSLTKTQGIIHATTPQVVMYNNAFDIVDVYEKGCSKSIHEIDELYLQQLSRERGDSKNDKFRFGLNSARNFAVQWN
jgi:hypothetical protein